jgi:hypothetical protein
MVSDQLARNFVNHYPLGISHLRISSGAVRDNNTKKCDGNSDPYLQVAGNEGGSSKIDITLHPHHGRGFAKDEPANQNFE